GEKKPAAEAQSFGERVKAKFKNFLLGGLGAIRALPPSSAVHIARCDSYDGPILDTLKKQFEHFRAHLPPVAGKRVVLKPNLVEYHRDKVINTNPKVVDAVIQLFKDE